MYLLCKSLRFEFLDVANRKVGYIGVSMNIFIVTTANFKKKITPNMSKYAYIM